MARARVAPPDPLRRPARGHLQPRRRRGPVPPGDGHALRPRQPHPQRRRGHLLPPGLLQAAQGEAHQADHRPDREGPGADQAQGRPRGGRGRRRSSSQRLRSLYDDFGTAPRDDDPDVPVPTGLPETPRRHDHPRRARALPGIPRAVHRRRPARRARRGGAIAPATSPARVTIDTTHLEQAWNDFRTAFAGDVPADDEELAALLAGAIRACSDEVETGHWFEAEADGRHDRGRTPRRRQRSEPDPGRRLQRQRAGRAAGQAGRRGRRAGGRAYRPCSSARPSSRAIPRPPSRNRSAR